MEINRLQFYGKTQTTTNRDIYVRNWISVNRSFLVCGAYKSEALTWWCSVEVNRSVSKIVGLKFIYFYYDIQ
jgi:hypothetical protein